MSESKVENLMFPVLDTSVHRLFLTILKIDLTRHCIHSSSKQNNSRNSKKKWHYNDTMNHAYYGYYVCMLQVMGMIKKMR